MVNIPTTDRQYYNFTPKVNTFGTYATALYDVAKGSVNTYAGIKKEQETVKMNSLSTQARMDMEAATQDFYVKNESDPFNPEALKSLQSTYNEISNNYKNQLDPIVRMEWDNKMLDLKGAFDLKNQTWGFKQRQINTENAIKNSMKNFYSLAAGYGRDGNYELAMVDFGTGYNQMLDDGARVLGSETAAALLNDFEKNYAMNFINGVSQTNPKQALNLLNNDKDLQRMLGEDTAKVAKGVINGMISQQNYNMKVAEFNYQLECMDAIDKAPTPVDKIRVLEEYGDTVSKKFYNSQLKALMRNANITNDTRDEKYTELFERAAASYPDEFQAIKARTELLDDIEEAYGNGELKYTDKRSLVKSVTTKKVKSFEALDKVEDDNITWGWDKGEMIQKAKELFPDKKDYSRAIYKYAVALSEADTDDSDLSDSERKKIADQVFKDVAQEKVNQAINQEKKKIFGKKIGKYTIVGER